MPPPAPARFSITTGCLRISSIFLVRMRAITSLGPPGAKPRIRVIGLVGNCAAAGVGQVLPSAATQAASKLTRIGLLHAFLAFAVIATIIPQNADGVEGMQAR